MKQDMIVVLDLGSEENPKIAREIRALGVYSEIHPHDITLAELKALPNVKGIILNGGPNRVVDGVEIDAGDHVYNGSVPVLLAGVKGKHPWPAEPEERKAALFARFGIDKFAEVKVVNLSTGMKQKVSLVVSIVHDPDIIIFDEPTNGLDVITAKVVTDFLEELKSEGKTIIVSTHIFSLIEKLCDRVGIIISGKMILCDTLENVCGGMNLEDRFFEIYKETVGDGE